MHKPTEGGGMNIGLNTFEPQFPHFSDGGSNTSLCPAVGRTSTSKDLFGRDSTSFSMCIDIKDHYSDDYRVPLGKFLIKILHLCSLT